jgi:hypothetical protein
MAVSHNDRYMLGTDPTFQNRVMTSLVAACVSIMNEGWPGGGGFHKERAKQATAILQAPSNYKGIYAQVVATDPSCIADATVAGTVALTVGNVAAQAALVTDAHIDNAVSGQFNSFFPTPQS